jgi:hypothetical protein
MLIYSRILRQSAVTSPYVSSGLDQGKRMRMEQDSYLSRVFL